MSNHPQLMRESLPDVDRSLDLVIELKALGWYWDENGGLRPPWRGEDVNRPITQSNPRRGEGLSD